MWKVHNDVIWEMVVMFITGSYGIVLVENFNESVGKVTNKTRANIRIAHRIHKSNVTLPPISDSHKKMWPDKKKPGVVRTWADVVSE